MFIPLFWLRMTTFSKKYVNQSKFVVIFTRSTDCAYFSPRHLTWPHRHDIHKNRPPAPFYQGAGGLKPKGMKFVILKIVVL